MTPELIIDRSRYDDANKDNSIYKAPEGLSEELVKEISKQKKEPEWMLKKRLMAFELFQKTHLPNWGPNLNKLDLNKITYFAMPNAKEARKWEDVPDEIKRTFEKIGIPEAERRALSGVGAQYDSGMVYHNLKKEWEEKGVIFENMDVALQKYPEIVKKYFMTSCIPISDHKFIMLHAAVWSGGTFIYVPPYVTVDIPLQAYFRMNAERGGQFEHTLIIADKGSVVHYLEGCFRKGSLVTTNPNYKKIEEIKVGEKILTHKAQYKKVKEIYKTPYSGTIKKIKLWGNSIDLIEATNEHPFLYVDREKKNERNKNWKLRWNIPKFFKKGDYLAIPINKTTKIQDFKEVEIKEWKGKNKGFMTKKEFVPSTKEFFKLAGYYLAEGSISSGHYLNFSFGSHEKELIEDAKNLLKKTFNINKVLEVNHKKNNGTSLVICSTKLCRIFEMFGKGANKKEIPNWMMFETYEKQKHLIKGYFYGDGNYYNKNVKYGLKEVFRINSVSEKLIRQCRDILLRLGVISFLNVRDRSKEKRQAMYTLGVSGENLIKFGEIVGIDVAKEINNKKRATMFKLNKDFAFFPIREIKEENVKNEIVYNFSVEDDETYCISGVAVHNCSAPLYNESALHAGCVEIHVLEDAKVRYTSIENWSKNTFNLNTKRAIVHKNAKIEWINGNLGCLTEDSKIFTNPEGPIQINQIKSGDSIYVWDDENNKITKSLVKNKIFSGKKKVYKLEVAGREIEASSNHPFLTLIRKKNKDHHKKGFFHQEWKALEDLNKGDLIGISKKLPIKGESYNLPKIKIGNIIQSNNQFSKFKMDTKHLYNQKIKIPKKTNSHFMWLVGIILGDGHVDKKQNKINIATHYKEDYRDELIRILYKLFNYKVTEKKERYIVINSKILCELFTNIGISGNADTKKVPNWIFKLPQEEIMSFLAGYFDSDGHVCENAIAFTSVSKELLESIKLLGITLGFGVSRIFSHGKARNVKILGVECKAKDSWRLLFNGKKVKEIPSKCLKKKEKIEKIRTKRNFVSSKGLNFKSKTNDEIGFAKIDKISYIGIKDTYDIEVEKYHNFISNGIIVHNSGTTMLYPCSVLVGENSKSDSLGIAFAGPGQNQDTGSKVIHAANNTSSIIRSKSISRGGGISTYRGLVKAVKNAKNTKSSVECDALLIDNKSVSNTYPTMKIENSNVQISHEARVGKISDDEIFYLMSRGLNEQEAIRMIVSGFIDEVVKSLPLEYAVELNKLIELEMEESIG